MRQEEGIGKRKEEEFVYPYIFILKIKDAYFHELYKLPLQVYDLNTCSFY